MEIKKALPSDFDAIKAVYARARSFMRENGNPTQWGTVYPPDSTVMDDINREKLFKCVENDEILAVFYYAEETEPTYLKIDGEWLDSSPYAAVHRVASAGIKKGAALFCLNNAFEKSGHVRIDTHRDNIPMQTLLKKAGFIYRGIIYLENGDERIAFEKSSKRDA